MALLLGRIAAHEITPVSSGCALEIVSTDFTRSLSPLVPIVVVLMLYREPVVMAMPFNFHSTAGAGLASKIHCSFDSALSNTIVSLAKVVTTEGGTAREMKTVKKNSIFFSQL